MTVNRCLLHHRRQRRAAKARSEVRPAEPGRSEFGADELEAVRQALGRLDEDELGPLVLRYFCDLNATRIGEILSLPAATVRGRLRKARLKLAEMLGAKDENDAGG